MLPGICELADLFKQKWGYCQIEHDMPTIPVSPPLTAKKELLKQSKSRAK